MLAVTSGDVCFFTFGGGGLLPKIGTCIIVSMTFWTDERKYDDSA